VGGTLLVPEPTQASEAASKSYVDNKVQGLAFAELTNILVNDINQSSDTPISFNTTALHNSNTTIFTPTILGIEVEAAGVYEVMTNIYMTSTSARTNVALEITVNGVSQGVRGAGAYIRSASGHNEASGHVSQLVTLNVGDIVGVTAQKISANGAVAVPAGQSNLIIKKLN